MTFKQEVQAVDFFKRCSCGGPHGLALYVDADDGGVDLIDEHYRLWDNLDLRGVWQRIKAAWWSLSGQHHGFASMVLHGDDLREFADRLSEAADKHDQWRRLTPQPPRTGGSEP